MIWCKVGPVAGSCGEIETEVNLRKLSVRWKRTYMNGDSILHLQKVILVRI